MGIIINGEYLWIDFEAWKKEKEFLDKKEKEYWDYHFSGQRTIDLFGIEGAKRVLAMQDRNDRKMIFKHKSRGKL